ncbi:hypothetical protein GCM10017764_09310 [Sphingobacterium griseoflavum]|uniref:Uncharacterized protein n=2 Tax=Sphingobacterium griseoflavum TaxID=1474952 RepID=A0ABQ3HUC8_9SPHI|nr:hypothetical protein GCM10017764_09310 [Sphingobacterium griseoflavum]
MYYGISALIAMVRSGLDLVHILAVAFFVLSNYLIGKFVLPFYRKAAEDSKLTRKHVIKTRILKIEKEFLSDMGMRYVVYTDLTPPIISTYNVLIFKQIDYTKLVEGQMIEIHAVDLDCKRILSIQF